MLAEGVLRLNSHLLGFVYENIISSSHSTDSVKRNGISKKKRGITLPTVVKLKGRVNFAAHKGLLNDFFLCQNLHDSLIHSRIGRLSRSCHEKFVSIRSIPLQSERKSLRCYVGLMDRWIKVEDFESQRNMDEDRGKKWGEPINGQSVEEIGKNQGKGNY